MSMSGRTWQSEKYRYGFNGKENDGDIGEGVTDFGARLMNSKIGRWMAVDPLAGKFPSMSPYVFSNNNPILFIDPDGMAAIPYTIKNRLSSTQRAYLNNVALPASKTLSNLYNKIDKGQHKGFFVTIVSTAPSNGSRNYLYGGTKYQNEDLSFLPSSGSEKERISTGARVQINENIKGLSLVNTIFHELTHVDRKANLAPTNAGNKESADHETFATSTEFQTQLMQVLTDVKGSELTTNEKAFHQWFGLEGTNTFNQTMYKIGSDGKTLKEIVDGKERAIRTEEGQKYFQAKSTINIKTGYERR